MLPHATGPAELVLAQRGSQPVKLRPDCPACFFRAERENPDGLSPVPRQRGSWLLFQILRQRRNVPVLGQLAVRV
jgi:hypothetical protein